MQAYRLLAPIISLLAFVNAPVFPMQEREARTADAEETNPFSLGERLVYVVKWDPPWYLFFLPTMDAGEVDFKLTGDVEYKDRKAWKIVFNARSSGVLSKVAGVKIDDKFVFVTEPHTFCSLNVSKSIREGKRNRQIDVEYLRKTNQLHIREMDESADPPKLKKDEIKNNIPPCVLDPLSAIYSLRTSGLNIKHEQDFVIGHDDRIKEIRIHVEKKETIETPAGKYPAWSIKTVALLGGLFKEGGQFRLWLSADRKKLPLQFEVKVSLGKIVGKLKSVPD
jgi:hypothetical protein